MASTTEQANLHELHFLVACLPFFRMHFTSPAPLTLHDEPLRRRSRDNSEGFLAGRLTVKPCQRRWALSVSATPENWLFNTFGSASSSLCPYAMPGSRSLSRTVVVWHRSRSPFPFGMAWLGARRLVFSLGADMCLGEPELPLPSKGWRSSSLIAVHSSNSGFDPANDKTDLGVGKKVFDVS